jgi:hypothetical protein
MGEYITGALSMWQFDIALCNATKGADCLYTSNKIATGRKETMIWLLRGKLLIKPTSCFS